MCRRLQDTSEPGIFMGQPGHQGGKGQCMGQGWRSERCQQSGSHWASGTVSSEETEDGLGQRRDIGLKGLLRLLCGGRCGSREPVRNLPQPSKPPTMVRKMGSEGIQPAADSRYLQKEEPVRFAGGFDTKCERNQVTDHSKVLGQVANAWDRNVGGLFVEKDQELSLAP